VIRNEKEYREAVDRLKAEKQRLDEHRASLTEEGLDKASIKNLMDPLQSFHLQLKEEVESYERLKRGHFDELQNLRGIGPLLVAARIARGMTQRDLAAKLDVHETQVSRDERNEYHSVSVERAIKIFEALGVRLTTQVELTEAT